MNTKIKKQYRIMDLAVGLVGEIGLNRKGLTRIYSNAIDLEIQRL